MLGHSRLGAILTRVAILLLIAAVKFQQIFGIVAEVVGVLGQFVGERAAEPVALLLDLLETRSFRSFSSVLGIVGCHEILPFVGWRVKGGGRIGLHKREYHTFTRCFHPFIIRHFVYRLV